MNGWVAAIQGPRYSQLRYTRVCLVMSFTSWILLEPLAHADDSLARKQAAALVQQSGRLADAHDIPGALASALRALELHASGTTTVNAAEFLKELGRYDEALDLCEMARARFQAKLQGNNGEKVPKLINWLMKRVGTVEVSGNIDGAEVFVDGKKRPYVPDWHHIHVLPGSHRIRLSKQGFAPWELQVTVQAQRSTYVVVELKPNDALMHIDASGELAAGATVYIDGRSVGPTPWEGLVRSGDHVVWATQGGRASSPLGVNAVKGEITNVHIGTASPGAVTRIRANPASAAVTVDGIAVPAGRWFGPLPAGQHQVAVSAAGYLPRAQAWTVPADGKPATLDITLQEPRSHFWLGDFMGYALVPSLRSEAEASCAKFACTNRGVGGGAFVGLRLGYELPLRLSFEVSAGVTRLTERFSRTFQHPPDGSAGLSIQYNLNDNVRLQGPFASLGVSYQRPLGRVLAFETRLSTGLVCAHSQNPIVGTASDGQHRMNVLTYDSRNVTEPVMTSLDFFVMPELGGTVRNGPLSIGASVAVAFFFLNGPLFSQTIIADQAYYLHREPSSSGCRPSAPDVHCASASGQVQNERAYGPFSAFIPQISARYLFH